MGDKYTPVPGLGWRRCAPHPRAAAAFPAVSLLLVIHFTYIPQLAPSLSRPSHPSLCQPFIGPPQSQPVCRTQYKLNRPCAPLLAPSTLSRACRSSRPQIIGNNNPPRRRPPTRNDGAASSVRRRWEARSSLHRSADFPKGTRANSRSRYQSSQRRQRSPLPQTVTVRRTELGPGVQQDMTIKCRPVHP